MLLITIISRPAKSSYLQNRVDTYCMNESNSMLDDSSHTHTYRFHFIKDNHSYITKNESTLSLQSNLCSSISQILLSSPDDTPYSHYSPTFFFFRLNLGTSYPVAATAATPKESATKAAGELNVRSISNQVSSESCNCKFF